MRAGGPDTEGERLPPILERRMLDGRGEHGGLDVVQPGRNEQLDEMPLARAGELRLVVDGGIELLRDGPEVVQRACATGGVIPHARGDDTTSDGDAAHLAEAGNGVGHEMDDELREGAVEPPIGIRQSLGGAFPHVDTRMAFARRSDERVGRIDRGNGRRAEPLNQLPRERTRAAPDVEGAVAVRDVREIGEWRGELGRVAAHEPVVGRGGDGEAHGAQIYGNSGGPRVDRAHAGLGQNPAMRTDGLEIRRLTANDLPEHLDGLAAVLADCVAGGASVSYMAPFTEDDARREFETWATEVARGTRILLVALTGDEVVGTVQVVFAWPPNQPHRADIAKLLVRRSARGRGVAQRLMERAEAEARTEGRTLLVLDTVTGDAAERLYERLGWNRVGVIPNFALYPDGRPCDTTVFWKAV